MIDLRCARVLAEGIHHVAHGLDLLDDRVGRAVEYLAVLAVILGRYQRLMRSAASRIGCQRVLDLVCQASRDFAPGRIPLRQQQLGDVIEDDDRAAAGLRVAGQRRACAVEDAPAAVRAQYDLSAPFGGASLQVRLQRFDELRDDGVALTGIFPGCCRSGSSDRSPAPGPRHRWQYASCRLVPMAMTPVERLPRMVARLARSFSSCCWLLRPSSRARFRRSIMPLKDSIRKPISSAAPRGKCVSKLPLATASVPMARASIGAESRREK